MVMAVIVTVFVLLVGVIIFILNAFKCNDAYSLIAAAFCSWLIFVSVEYLDLSQAKSECEKSLQLRTEKCIYQKEHL